MFKLPQITSMYINEVFYLCAYFKSSNCVILYTWGFLCSPVSWCSHLVAKSSSLSISSASLKSNVNSTLSLLAFPPHSNFRLRPATSLFVVLCSNRRKRLVYVRPSYIFLRSYIYVLQFLRLLCLLLDFLFFHAGSLFDHRCWIKRTLSKCWNDSLPLSSSQLCC